jgi:7-carboxy-7-deazaguanine synthase
MQDDVEGRLLYPIAEKFVSPQGEGRFTGTLMQFIRFAGCTVGKPFTNQERAEQQLPIYQERCTTYDGRSFACDTDYRVTERLTVAEIVKWTVSHNVKFVLFTGGEPLMRDVSPLVRALKHEAFEIHVETSGTIRPDLNQSFWRNLDWVCCSPKKGFLDAYADNGIANEFKLLVDEDFDWDKVPRSIQRKPSKICFSPINDEKTINQANVQRCLQLQREHPASRVTMQMHKLWQVR